MSAFELISSIPTDTSPGGFDLDLQDERLPAKKQNSLVDKHAGALGWRDKDRPV
ncbi:hypothetical protein [Bradyrhizobium sp. I71]|uniref:hypothetical protein n=1 Tax=Bradyrhizobium sp. I71 TaxID=2590772 RepID=UPI001EF80FE9|nr:hypothetical protein [Bradyrhizobium sp. I71]ULK98823.1 hypothetical protein FJV43_03495 [Bradyrhizobium sp. I71]